MDAISDCNKYEHFAFMIRHSILSIRHTHSFTLKVEMMKKDLTKKTLEATEYLRQLNETNRKGEKQQAAITATKAKTQKVKLAAKATQERATKVERKLATTLATKEEQIK
ncbi:unnamed protein product [Camellia sinensis]